MVTGSEGLLGNHHCDVLRKAGATVVPFDLRDGYDVTNEGDVREVLTLASTFGEVSILINNAANNPKMGESESRLESLPLTRWNDDIAVGLTGAFLCSRVFGAAMERQGGGVIVNVCSDLAVIAPDQRLYRVEGWGEDIQPVKPVTYSVVKHGLLGLTKYLATYWKNVRCNAISPGGVENGQSEEFKQRLSNLIPMGRMARADEYESAILFLCSDASSYMNGANLVIDGGRSCW